MSNINYPIRPDYSNLRTFVINLDDYKEIFLKQLPYLETIGLKVERLLSNNTQLVLESVQFLRRIQAGLNPK